MSNGIPQGSPTLVSIILPVWNPQPKWLAEAIDSAFHESGCEIEVVLVDDGSDLPPDAWLSSRDAGRVRVIRVPHRGVGHARNVALQHCRGEFIRFLDSDDVILPESTSLLLKLTRGMNNIVTYGSTIVCDADLQPQSMIRSRLHSRIHFQTAMGHFHSMIQAMLIPHKVAIAVGGFDERLVVQGDWDFVLRVSEVMEFCDTQQPVFLYRRHENSLTWGGAPRKAAIHSTVLIIKGYLKRHPELSGTSVERRVRAYAQFQIAKFRNPGRAIFSQRFWLAVAADPVRGIAIASAQIAAITMRTVKNKVFSKGDSVLETRN
ncbi:MAG TPA: glycosyltransferase family 2 protein [Chloroflexota bacterium]|nr:glycosyltransferase family 2 protein [Chloroflexota bacterium]HUM67927.1 glycosyltransferase family 2 protein [Chloroflexota bacterium]